jgi:hypothetical protein
MPHHDKTTHETRLPDPCRFPLVRDLARLVPPASALRKRLGNAPDIQAKTAMLQEVKRLTEGFDEIGRNRA